MDDVQGVLEQWVVVPGCGVALQLDDADPIDIGFASIGDALRSRLEQDGYACTAADESRPKDGDICVEEVEDVGLQLAFGKSWSSHFQEWSLVNAKDRSSQEPQETPLGTCVEGIRVEDVTPGFRSSCFYAMANASGASAPRTDVARTVLENTPERQALLEKVFRQYSKSIASEVMALRERGFSLTWSAQEARFLASPLSRRAAQDPLLAAREIAKIPSVVIDDGEKRHLRTPADIKAMRVFWTVESNFFRSAESLLRETPSTASVTSLTQALGVRSFDIPSGPLVTSGAAYASTPLMVGREVSRVVLRPRERRVDLAWENRDDPARWWDLMPDRAAVADRLPWYSDALMGRAISRTRESERILVARPSSVDVDGQESLTVVRSRGLALVLPGSPIADYLSDVLDHCEERDDELAIAARVLLAEASAQFTRRASPLPGMDQSSILEYLERLRGDIFRRERHAGDELVDVDEFARALTREPIRVFDSWAWNRATDGAQDG
jgi:hypothetical protein